MYFIFNFFQDLLLKNSVLYYNYFCHLGAIFLLGNGLMVMV